MLNQARNVMHATLGEFNDVGHDKGLSINYVITYRGGGVSPKDYSIT